MSKRKNYSAIELLLFLKLFTCTMFISQNISTSRQIFHYLGKHFVDDQTYFKGHFQRFVRGKKKYLN